MKMNDKDGMHMGLKGRAQNCAECEFMKMYDYGNKICYCDNEDRIDDMGKLSVGETPEGKPEGCPLERKADEKIILYALDEMQKRMYENMPGGLKGEYDKFCEKQKNR